MQPPSQVPCEQAGRCSTLSTPVSAASGAAPLSDREARTGSLAALDPLHLSLDALASLPLREGRFNVEFVACVCDTLALICMGGVRQSEGAR